MNGEQHLGARSQATRGKRDGDRAAAAPAAAATE
jgi:hypothetical protein